MRTLLLILLLPLAACGSSVTEASIAGTWKIDFAASWARSKPAFLADTLRGASNYPTDPEEKAKIVHDEMQNYLAELTHVYESGGKLTKRLGKDEMSGTWKVVTANPPRFEVEETTGRTAKATLAFESANRMVWNPPKGPELVFDRK